MNKLTQEITPVIEPLLCKQLLSVNRAVQEICFEYYPL